MLVDEFEKFEDLRGGEADGYFFDELCGRPNLTSGRAAVCSIHSASPPTHRMKLNVTPRHMVDKLQPLRLGQCPIRQDLVRSTFVWIVL